MGTRPPRGPKYHLCPVPPSSVVTAKASLLAVLRPQLRSWKDFPLFPTPTISYCHACTLPHLPFWNCMTLFRFSSFS